MRTFIHGRQVVSSSEAWEDAYRRFETPDQELTKFLRRLRGVEAERWSRRARIAELFCGRGSGLLALARLGFVDLEGIDLSPSLVQLYTGPGRAIVGDCRDLPWPNAAKDIMIVQGGLHHLMTLPGDLERVLSESRRVLSPGGKFVAVEPWLTPSLQAAHLACFSRLRAFSWKLDALATMVEHERQTYEQWLRAPELIRSTFERYFRIEHLSFSWGKVRFVGVNNGA
jgi:SAM-dependent methyltransferase